MTAVKYRNTIYMHREESDDQMWRRRHATEKDLRMSSWGYKFEQFMCADEDGLDTDVNRRPANPEPVVESEEFCCVYRTRLGPHSIVFGAEMDAIQPRSDGEVIGDKETIDLNEDTFVELKTSRNIEHEGQERSFCRFKLLKWWCQSFLVGIPEVICGFRDDDGLVHTITQFDMKDIVRKGSEYWKPNVCMAFLSDLLGHISRVMSDKADLTVVEFFHPQRQHKVQHRIMTSPADVLLPDWYRSIFPQSHERSFMRD